jgi:hypothetical protein
MDHFCQSLISEQKMGCEFTHRNRTVRGGGGMVAIDVCGKESLVFSKVKSVAYMLPLQKCIFLSLPRRQKP